MRMSWLLHSNHRKSNHQRRKQSDFQKNENGKTVPLNQHEVASLEAIQLQTWGWYDRPTQTIGSQTTGNNPIPKNEAGMMAPLKRWEVKALESKFNQCGCHDDTTRLVGSQKHRKQSGYKKWVRHDDITQTARGYITGSNPIPNEADMLKP